MPLPALIPAVGAAAGMAARVAAPAAVAIGRGIAGAVGGAAQMGASIVGQAAGSMAGGVATGLAASGGRGGRDRDDVIDADFEVIDDGSNRGGGGGRDIVPAQPQGEPTGTAIVPFEDIPERFEVVPVPQEEDQSPAERLLDTLDRIDDNTAMTAAGVEKLVDAQEDQPLEGPVDVDNDPNDGTQSAKKEESGGLFGGIMKSIKKLFSKVVLFFIAAAAVVGAILTGGAGDTFEKLKEAFTRLTDALAPVLQTLMETVMPALLDLFDVLVEIFVKLVEVLAPILKTIIETVVPPLMKMFTLLAEVFLNLIEFVSPILPVIAEYVAKALGLVVGLINGVLEFLTDPIGYLKDGLSYLADGGDMILAGLGDFINGIIGFIAGLVENIPMVGEKAAAALRNMEVEFGDNARERMATREQERADRAAARGDGPEEPTPVDVSPEDAERLEASQQETVRAATGTGNGTQRVETNAGPTIERSQPDGSRVDVSSEIASTLQKLNPKEQDGVITIKKSGRGPAGRRRALRYEDINRNGEFTNQEVDAALATLGVVKSPDSDQFQLQGAQGANVQLESAPDVGPRTGAGVQVATEGAQVASEQAAQSGGGGANINAPMQNNNVQNINNTTSTGVIYNGGRSTLGGRSRILPGVSAKG